MANDHDDSLDVTRRALLRVGGGLGLGLLTTHTMAAGTAAAAPLGAQLAGAMPSVSGASNTADILVETEIRRIRAGDLARAALALGAEGIDRLPAHPLYLRAPDVSQPKPRP